MFELFMYVYSCNALSTHFFAVDRALNSYFMITSRSRRNGSTCVDLVEDCKKATCIHFLCRNKVKSKERKQNYS